MALIFFASTDFMSSERTSRIFGPLLRWFNRNISDDTVRRVQFVARKTGHVLEYAILSILLWRAVSGSRQDGRRGWSWYYGSWALGIAVVYAITDELHQALVPSRYGSPLDILLDSSGAILGLICVWAFASRAEKASAPASVSHRA